MSDQKITILVDLDGTLAHYEGWNDGIIGPPVPVMVDRVKDWLNLGYEVKVFTARVAGMFNPASENAHAARHDALTEYVKVNEWVLTHIGRVLTITAVKDRTVTELWDDRAVRVEKNTGVSELHEAHLLLSAAGVPEGALSGRVQALVDRLVEAIQFKGSMGGRDL